jgi:predicted PurR-regulated permease PerM
MRFIWKKKRASRFAHSILAAVFAILTTLVILVPLTFIVTQLVQQIVQLTKMANQAFEDKPRLFQNLLISFCDFVSRTTSGQVNITPQMIHGALITALNNGMHSIVAFSSGLVVHIGSFVISLALVIFCLFFFYLDGRSLVHMIKSLIPIRKDYVSAIFNKFRVTARNLILGYILVALVQAILAYIVFSIFRITGAMVFAVLTFFAVMVPMLGGALVWLPLGIAEILSHGLLHGILFMVVAGGCISLLDNFLRPMFLTGRINLHPLIIFFAIMGGLRAFGFNGLLLGPIIVILFLTVLDMFMNEHDAGRILNDGV